ncbi:MAG: hypothetical protein RI953_995 [Pseudomonadota bacterium]|jgi:chromosome partitioning protein
MREGVGMQDSASPRSGKITGKQINEMGERAQVHLSSIRSEILKPHPRKEAPLFKSGSIAELCGIERRRIDWLVGQPESPYPQGSKHGTRIRYYSVPEVKEFYRLITKPKTRPAGTPGTVICFGIFKGGVAKTSTAVAMAQALTLRNLSVLLIDLDPQGSATQLCGLAPDAEIDASDTARPIFCDPDDEEYQSSLLPLIIETYWPGLDLVPACSMLHGAEYEVANQLRRAGESRTYFPFWAILDKALADARQHYDVVIIDTPPSLSYTTLNALYASDGIVAPVPPSALDFASSTQFWTLLGEVLSKAAPTKTFDFVNILLTKCKTGHPITSVLTQWISDAYGPFVLPIQIPESRAIDNATTAFQTLYDISSPDGSLEAFLKVKQPLDQLAAYLYGQIVKKWEI